MARPKPEIIKSQEQHNGDVWQILEAEDTYVITYKGKCVSVRVEKLNMNTTSYSYKRMSYSELGTVLSQVRRYNKMFNCKDFDYIKV